jgi:hypothetical protein
MIRAGAGIFGKHEPEPHKNGSAQTTLAVIYTGADTKKSTYTGIYEQKKSYTTEFLWLLHIQKRLRFGHLFRPGSGSDKKGPDPDLQHCR